VSSQPGITAEDAIQVAQRALRKVNEVESELSRLREENEHLRQRVTELEVAQPDADDYTSLDRDAKVGMIRQHALAKADDNSGLAQLDYHAIRWEVFNGEPSCGHSYDLMEQAAEAGGFHMGTTSDDNKALKVVLPEVSQEKRQRLLSRANKEDTE